MELRNEWGLLPALQTGTPYQRSRYAAPETPWWQRTFPGFDDPSRGQGQDQGPNQGQGQDPNQ